MPTPAVASRPAAARRTHQPSRRRVRGMAGAHVARLPGNRGRHHPRSLLFGQRGRMDSGVGPRSGHSLRGQLLGLAGAKTGPTIGRGEGRLGPQADHRTGIGMGPYGTQGAPVQGQGTPLGLRPAGSRVSRGRDPGPRTPDRHPGQPATRRSGHRGRPPVQGRRRSPADRC